MTNDPGHWETYLVAGFHEPTDVTITVDPNTTRGAMVLLASRLRGIFDALSPRRDTETGHDPLADEQPADLLRLADHLHRVTTALVEEEDRVIAALDAQGVSARRIAGAMEVDHKTIVNRFKRIARAQAMNVATLALTEREADDATATGPEQG